MKGTVEEITKDIDAIDPQQIETNVSIEKV